MKKIFKLIPTTLLMMLILPIGTLAENDNSLYAYTEVDSVIEEYAKDKVGVFMDSSYTPANIQSYTGCVQSASKTTLANYLKSKGLNCNYSNSGYLSFSDVTNIIYNKGYIYMSAKSNSRDVSHAFVIYGYVDDGTNKLYTFGILGIHTNKP